MLGQKKTAIRNIFKTRFLLGLLLFLFGGLGIFISLQLPGPGFCEKIPWELFKFSLFTVIIGAISLIYSAVIEKIKSENERRSKIKTAFDAINSDLRTIFNEVKLQRRTIRIKNLSPSKDNYQLITNDFFDIVNKLNECELLLEYHKKVSLESQLLERPEIDSLKNNLEDAYHYLEDIIEESEDRRKYKYGETVEIPKTSSLGEFASKFSGGSSFDTNFKIPIKAATKILSEIK